MTLRSDCTSALCYNPPPSPAESSIASDCLSSDDEDSGDGKCFLEQMIEFLPEPIEQVTQSVALAKFICKLFLNW